ncbi:MAG: histidinol-phosphate transaminase [Nitrospirota bacterium]
MTTKTRKTKDIIDLVLPAVRGLAAYHVDETSVRVKLDAMENPFLLPDKILKEIGKAAQQALINRYPDPSAKKLKQAIARYWKMDAERMLLGNGSDELIQAVILAFGGPVLAPSPSFAMYEITARALSQKAVTVPLTAEFDLDPDAVIKAAKRTKAKVIFLACPNNPTGNRFSDAAVRKVLENVDAAVVLDEAYFSFSGKTFLPFLNRHRNMIILRTLSKIGLAGLRVGVLTASKEIIGELNKIRLPYNINSMSQATGQVALRHATTLNKQISLLISERRKLYNALLRTPGVTPFPTETNFILMWIEKDATRVFQALKKRGILVKNLDKPGPLQGCMRVTIGTPAENKEFLKNLKDILTTD